MRFFTPYRLAAYALVLFFAGHTAGGMLKQESMGQESDAVFSAMKSVHFNLNGSTSSWYGFWFGFGLTVSAFLLLAAVMAWQLDKVPPGSWPMVRVLAWALVLSVGFNTYIAWRYFFVVPGMLSTLSTILLAVGALRKGRVPA